MVALVGNIATRSSCGFAKKKFMGKETEVILSARARLSARNRGVFRQVLAKTCGDSATRYPYPWISPDTKAEAPRISTYCS